MTGLPIAALGARPRLLLCLDLAGPQAASDADVRVSSYSRACERVLEHARGTGWTVVHVHARNGGCVRTSAGTAIRPNEPLLSRTGASAFSCPEFTALARDNPQAELVIIGASADAAVLATALAAYERGMAVAVVQDAVSVSPQEQSGLDGLAQVIQALAGAAVRFVAAESLIGRPRHFAVIEGGFAAGSGRAP